MGSEFEEESEKTAAQYKDTLFAHAIVNQNPDIFTKLYPETFGMSPEDEAQLEFEIPESPADLERMMAELRDTGWG